MDKVKEWVASGVGLADAVKAALQLTARSISSIAAEYEVDRSNLSSGLNGARALSDREICALMFALGGTADEWKELLADAAQKRILAASA